MSELGEDVNLSLEAFNWRVSWSRGGDGNEGNANDSAERLSRGRRRGERTLIVGGSLS